MRPPKNNPAFCGDCFLVDGYDWIEIVGKQKFAGWVRKQVDLINIVQSNRYGFPVVSALPAEGVPKASTKK